MALDIILWRTTCIRNPPGLESARVWLQHWDFRMYSTIIKPFLMCLWPHLRRHRVAEITSLQTAARCTPVFSVAFLPSVYLVKTRFKKNPKNHLKLNSIILVFWNGHVYWPGMLLWGARISPDFGITSFSSAGTALGKEKQNEVTKELLLSGNIFGSVVCDGKAIAATTVPGLLHGQWFSSSPALQVKVVTLWLFMRLFCNQNTKIQGA